MRTIARFALASLLTLPAVAHEQPQPPAQPARAASQPAPASWKDKLFFGGGIGASFGDVDYIEIAPMIGYRIDLRLSTGVGVFWRSRSDNRYSPSIDTTDYGGNVFMEAIVAHPLFIRVEYEYVDFEFPLAGGGTLRDSSSSVLVGAGVFHPLGGDVGFYAAALYNVSYDGNELTGPYDGPWVYRAGVSAGF